MPRRKTITLEESIKETLEISIKLHVTPTMYDELKAEAAARDWSVPKVVRFAIRDWFMRAH
jgi:hypothetical protein